MLALTNPSAASEGWQTPAEWWSMITDATAHRPAPVAVISHDALSYNAMDMLVRAGGMPIRVASKSIRVRSVLDAVLALPGYRGILAFTLPEALWLSDTHDDIVVGYPSVDAAALTELMTSERAASRITLMVDDVSQLDLLDSLVPASSRPRIRVAIDADASWRAPVLGHVGVRRSPVHTPSEVRALAQRIADRPGVTLVGLMMYEAQIAGQTDASGHQDGLMRWMKKQSGAELFDRRHSIVAGVREVAELEFVNGGGTGSLEYTSADDSVTEVTAGSGFLAGTLFDDYAGFDLAPAAAFGFDVVRKPTHDIATILGGGWIASGPPVASRQPKVAWPANLRTLAREGAGEVQTPLQGDAAIDLRVGDRVWLRHAKSGEGSERVNSYDVVSNGELIDEAVTYRGEGKAFL